MHHSSESAFRDIYFASDKLDPVPSGEVAAFEGWLRERFGLPLPPGYREYVTRLGVGTYCDLIQVHPPADVMGEFEPIGKLWGTHFFWEAGRGVLSEDQVERSFAVATSVDGDEIVCCPGRPGELFVLPRHDDHIYRMPAGLLDPLAWDGFSSVARREPPPFLYFEPDRDLPGVAVFVARSPATTRFVNEYDPDGTRHQVMTSRAAPVDLSRTEREPERFDAAPGARAGGVSRKCPLIGREREAAELHTLLEREALVTLP